MKRQPPPLRFLTGVVGLWVCARALVLAPDWWIERSVAAPGPAATPKRALAGPADAASPSAGAAGRPAFAAPRQQQQPLLAAAARPSAPRVQITQTLAAALDGRPPEPHSGPLALSLLQPSALPPRPLSPQPGRFSGSAWLLLREDRSAALAPGGTLGGSQSGLRLLYRLNGDAARPLALSARLYTPASSRRAAEAALGIDWRPLARLPVHVLAERRQALGRDGRSAFALALHGGLSAEPLPGGFRLDAYGQAGLVGARSRDLFADGSARITLPLGRASVGAGVWGGAQPGAARLDVGPHASLRLPFAGEHVRLTGEWRLRVAGDASPGSGPVLTLGSDF